MSDDEGLNVGDFTPDDLNEAVQLAARRLRNLAGKKGGRGIRYVRTPEGSRFYGQPIGTPITADVIAAAEAKNGKKSPKNALAYNKPNKAGVSATGSRQSAIGKHTKDGPHPVQRVNNQPGQKSNTQKAQNDASQQAATPRDPNAPAAVQPRPATYKRPEDLPNETSEHFDIDGQVFEIPANSTLVRNEKSGVAYVRTPDGGARMFTKDGEVELQENERSVISRALAADVSQFKSYELAEPEPGGIDEVEEQKANMPSIGDSISPESLDAAPEKSIITVDDPDFPNGFEYTKKEDGLWYGKDDDQNGYESADLEGESGTFKRVPGNGRKPKKVQEAEKSDKADIVDTSEDSDTEEVDFDRSTIAAVQRGVEDGSLTGEVWSKIAELDPDNDDTSLDLTPEEMDEFLNGADDEMTRGVDQVESAKKIVEARKRKAEAKKSTSEEPQDSDAPEGDDKDGATPTEEAPKKESWADRQRRRGAEARQAQSEAKAKQDAEDAERRAGARENASQETKDVEARLEAERLSKEDLDAMSTGDEISVYQRGQDGELYEHSMVKNDDGSWSAVGDTGEGAKDWKNKKGADPKGLSERRDYGSAVITDKENSGFSFEGALRKDNDSSERREGPESPAQEDPEAEEDRRGALALENNADIDDLYAAKTGDKAYVLDEEGNVIELQKTRSGRWSRPEDGESRNREKFTDQELRDRFGAVSVENKLSDDERERRVAYKNGRKVAAAQSRERRFQQGLDRQINEAGDRNLKSSKANAEDGLDKYREGLSSDENESIKESIKDRMRERWSREGRRTRLTPEEIDELFREEMEFRKNGRKGSERPTDEPSEEEPVDPLGPDYEDELRNAQPGDIITGLGNDGKIRDFFVQDNESGRTYLSKNTPITNEDGSVIESSASTESSAEEVDEAVKRFKRVTGEPESPTLENSAEDAPGTPNGVSIDFQDNYNQIWSLRSGDRLTREWMDGVSPGARFSLYGGKDGNERGEFLKDVDGQWRRTSGRLGHFNPRTYGRNGNLGTDNDDKFNIFDDNGDLVEEYKDSFVRKVGDHRDYRPAHISSDYKPIQSRPADLDAMHNGQSIVAYKPASSLKVNDPAKYIQFKKVDGKWSIIDRHGMISDGFNSDELGIEDMSWYKVNVVDEKADIDLPSFKDDIDPGRISPRARWQQAAPINGQYEVGTIVYRIRPDKESNTTPQLTRAYRYIGQNANGEDTFLGEDFETKGPMTLTYLSHSLGGRFLVDDTPATLARYQKELAENDGQRGHYLNDDDRNPILPPEVEARPHESYHHGEKIDRFSQLDDYSKGAVMRVVKGPGKHDVYIRRESDGWHRMNGPDSVDFEPLDLSQFKEDFKRGGVRFDNLGGEITEDSEGVWLTKGSGFTASRAEVRSAYEALDQYDGPKVSEALKNLPEGHILRNPEALRDVTREAREAHPFAGTDKEALSRHLRSMDNERPIYFGLENEESGERFSVGDPNTASRGIAKGKTVAGDFDRSDIEDAISQLESSSNTNVGAVLSATGNPLKDLSVAHVLESVHGKGNLPSSRAERKQMFVDHLRSVLQGPPIDQNPVDSNPVDESPDSGRKTLDERTGEDLFGSIVSILPPSTANGLSSKLDGLKRMVDNETGPYRLTDEERDATISLLEGVQARFEDELAPVQKGRLGNLISDLSEGHVRGETTADPSDIDTVGRILTEGPGDDTVGQVRSRFLQQLESIGITPGMFPSDSPIARILQGRDVTKGEVDEFNSALYRLYGDSSMSLQQKRVFADAVDGLQHPYFNAFRVTPTYSNDKGEAYAAEIKAAAIRRESERRAALEALLSDPVAIAQPEGTSDDVRMGRVLLSRARAEDDIRKIPEALSIAYSNLTVDLKTRGILPSRLERETIFDGAEMFIDEMERYGLTSKEVPSFTFTNKGFSIGEGRAIAWVQQYGDSGAPISVDYTVASSYRNSATAKAEAVKTKWKLGDPDGDPFARTMSHEFGHILENVTGKNETPAEVIDMLEGMGAAKLTPLERAMVTKNSYFDDVTRTAVPFSETAAKRAMYKLLAPLKNDQKLEFSVYSHTNIKEFIAEAVSVVIRDYDFSNDAHRKINDIIQRKLEAFRRAGQ